MNLDRFLDAQKSIYVSAPGELRAGWKHGHWMWFIFPQVSLGLTPTSLFYSIHNLKEAEDYLNHPVLGKRLHEMSDFLLNSMANSTIEIFGPIDALKLRSCMTLFASISAQEENVFQMVLMKFYAGERCEKTLELLG